jgi:hypothetical protein
MKGHSQKSRILAIASYLKAANTPEGNDVKGDEMDVR